ncbi:MAG: septation protein A [Flavobacteriaceae bacterium]|nr:MAG: septation protein A [Flavobacteriaceae bacterium]
MKLLLDFFPIVFFFIAFKMYDIYVATAVLIIASLLQTCTHWLMHRRFEKMHVITLVLVCVFGGLTLMLQDEMFIKWKPTVINWLFAVVFIGSQFIGKKSIIQRMMGDHMVLPANIWLHLNIAWTLFFIALGIANLYVVYNFDTETWVNFKLFGLLGLTFVFVIAQSLYVARFIKEPEDEQDNGTT